MTGSLLLVHLVAAVALLLWAVRMVRTGVERAFGQRLQAWVRTATSRAPQSLACGIGVATALQSSTAAAALIAGFVQRNTVSVTAGIAFMLGADIGSTLIVQALSISQPLALPLLLIAGVSLFMIGQRAAVKQVGRIAIGLALMVIALGMIGKASEPLRESWLMGQILAALSLDPLLTLLIGAALTWLLHSTVATILFIISLAGAGVVPPQAAALLVIAANIGAGLIPSASPGGPAPPSARSWPETSCAASLSAVPRLSPCRRSCRGWKRCRRTVPGSSPTSTQASIWPRPSSRCRWSASSLPSRRAWCPRLRRRWCRNARTTSTRRSLPSPRSPSPMRRARRCASPTRWRSCCARASAPSPMAMAAAAPKSAPSMTRSTAFRKRSSST